MSSDSSGEDSEKGRRADKGRKQPRFTAFDTDVCKAAVRSIGKTRDRNKYVQFVKKKLGEKFSEQSLYNKFKPLFVDAVLATPGVAFGDAASPPSPLGDASPPAPPRSSSEEASSHSDGSDSGPAEVDVTPCRASRGGVAALARTLREGREDRQKFQRDYLKVASEAADAQRQSAGALLALAQAITASMGGARGHP